MTSKKIKWKFNPPYAPHFGGVFETMIKAAKKAIVAIMGNSDVTDEELTSLYWCRSSDQFKAFDVSECKSTG